MVWTLMLGSDGSGDAVACSRQHTYPLSRGEAEGSQGGRTTQARARKGGGWEYTIGTAKTASRIQL